MNRATCETNTPDAQAIVLLLVDDEPAVLQSLQRLLRADQYQLHTAETGAQALACLEQTRVDVVVSDIRMPGMSGTELLAHIAARWPDTSRIALSGGADIVDAIAAINSGGVFRWIHKPWDADELRQTVQAAAERVRKIHATRRRFQSLPRQDHGTETLPHVIQTFFKGEVIHKEGSSGHQTHFIRTGKVELSMMRDGKRIIVDTRRAGDCFGVIAAVLHGNRTVTATAAEYTETFGVAPSVIDDLLRKNDSLLATMVKAMAEQTRRSLVNLAMRNPVVNPIESAACALDLMARAATPNHPATSVKSPLPPVNLPHSEVVQILSAVTGMVKVNVQGLLDQMACLNLLAIDGSRQVHVRPGEIVIMARKLSASHGDTLFEGLRAETELMNLEEMAEMVGVESSMIQHKMKQGELPETLWAFKKSETLRVVQEKGQDFFRQRKVKKVDDFDDINDLMSVDRDTLRRVLHQMDTDRVAMLLKNQRQELQERVLGSLSKRIRADVVDAMATIEAVDEAEVGLLEAEAIDRIKTVKGGAAANLRALGDSRR